MNHPPDIHARLTPAMRLLVERMAQAPHPPMHTLSAADAKATYAKSIGVLDVPKPDLPRVEDLHIPARDGFQLRARLVAGDLDLLVEVGLLVRLPGARVVLPDHGDDGHDEKDGEDEEPHAEKPGR